MPPFVLLFDCCSCIVIFIERNKLLLLQMIMMMTKTMTKTWSKNWREALSQGGGRFYTARKFNVTPAGQATALPPAAAVPLSQLLIFLPAWNAGVVIRMLFDGPNDLQKLALPLGESASNARFHGLSRVRPSNGISIGSAACSRLTNVTNRQTHRLTHRSTTLFCM